MPAKSAHRVLLSSKSPDWCTPPEFLDHVRKFASIRFDPFSSTVAVTCRVCLSHRPETS